MDRRTRCSFACVAALTTLFTIQNVIADDSDRSEAPMPVSATSSSIVSPTYAVSGAYGLSAYAPAVTGIPSGYVYTIPAYGPVIYYYPPVLYSPVYIDPYIYHFGLSNLSPYGPGHYRFPYYSYRRPWYTPGPPVFNRNTNIVW